MVFTNKHNASYLILIVLTGIVLLSSQQYDTSEKKHLPPTIESNKNTFDNYWYQGKAEISSFTLNQAHYGETHQGRAVLIFVTEPFSKSRQVKLNNIHGNEKDAVNILKLNLSKKFITGIYDYSILKSVFTPINLTKHPNTLKATSSIQEWCGHTFTQLNLGSLYYHMTLNSYYENEGDVTKEMEIVLLEDEIWSRIRINPKSLPTGNVKIIPSISSSRLLHTSIDAETAKTTLMKHNNDDNLLTYKIKYLNSKRSLSIDFEKKFPHRIERWQESYFSSNKLMTTNAIRIKTILSDYWNFNSNENKSLRLQLGL
ncbi:MAG: hypothetical protein MK207_06585 [Saprospiraceae bacterium]|nr:hypothetical protein [Saprospiraceae bacterium]